MIDDDVLTQSNSAGQSISMSAVGSKASGEKDMRDVGNGARRRVGPQAKYGSSSLLQSLAV